MKIAVAVSGGVDSMVSLHLLKAAGHDIFAIHFLTGYEKSENISHLKLLASHLKHLKIEMITVDISQAFQSKVVDYFISSYAKGQTPNPCVICNAKIKFGVLRELALKQGADCLATGHYAQTEKQSDGNYLLKRGIDLKKDQSYFLSMLSEKQLSTAVFPLGKWLKKDVVGYASKNGLSSIVQPESQEVCFIHERYPDFLIRSGCIKRSPGSIVTVSGQIIGQHNGLHEFTVGQRRGINCPGPYPYYVVRLEQSTNKLIVGKKSDLLSENCQVCDINWIKERPDKPCLVDVRIRYKSPAVPAELYPTHTNQATLYFNSQQSAVTPGQIAVFYNGDVVIGAGRIGV
ncbi:tRNA-specific 2-thiouridylase mnmA [Candidatus Magnetomorum sp. HK-1]|nr:tRNA-specific 2-thiouridylase mnmA [Candidatus Magnetomorum sp. HK-1]